jgi:hypothetical protein
MGLRGISEFCEHCKESLGSTRTENSFTRLLMDDQQLHTNLFCLENQRTKQNQVQHTDMYCPHGEVMTHCTVDVLAQFSSVRLHGVYSAVKLNFQRHSVRQLQEMSKALTSIKSFVSMNRIGYFVLL